MPAPPIPSPLQHLGQRPFSFYPPIVNIEHNQWIFRRAMWDEVELTNAKTGAELILPRRFLGEVSSIEDPVMIVGLLKELEYKEGVVLPHIRRVLEMPRVVNDSPRFAFASQKPERPAPVIGIRVESGSDSRAGKFVLGVIAAGILACVVVVSTASKVRVVEQARMFVPLEATDDYKTVVAKLGPPSSERWRTAPTGLQYHLLRYPRRSVTIVLTGGDREHMCYSGAIDRTGRVIHSVVLPGGEDSSALLRQTF